MENWCWYTIQLFHCRRQFLKQLNSYSFAHKCHFKRKWLRVPKSKLHEGVPTPYECWPPPPKRANVYTCWHVRCSLCIRRRCFFFVGFVCSFCVRVCVLCLRKERRLSSGKCCKSHGLSNIQNIEAIKREIIFTFSWLCLSVVLCVSVVCVVW